MKMIRLLSLSLIWVLLEWWNKNFISTISFKYAVSKSETRIKNMHLISGSNKCIFFNVINWSQLLGISFIFDFIWKCISLVILRLTNRISCSQFRISRLRRFSVSQFHSESSQKKLKSTLQWWFQPCKPIIHIKSVTITEQNHLTNRFCHFQTTEFKINTYGLCSS